MVAHLHYEYKLIYIADWIMQGSKTGNGTAIYGLVIGPDCKDVPRPNGLWRGNKNYRRDYTRKRRKQQLEYIAQLEVKVKHLEQVVKEYEEENEQLKKRCSDLSRQLC